MSKEPTSALDRSLRVVSVSFPVRFGEADLAGVVYYAHYLDYFTEARLQYLKEIGLSYLELQRQEGITFRVVEAACRYHAPAFFDDLLQVRARVSEMRSRSLTFAYEIYREQTLIATGSTELMFFREGKAVSVPQRLRQLLKEAAIEKRAAPG